MISSSDSKLPGNHLNSMINSTMYRNLLSVAFIRRISHHKILSRLKRYGTTLYWKVNSTDGKNIAQYLSYENSYPHSQKLQLPWTV